MLKFRYFLVLVGASLALSACGDAKVQGSFGKNKKDDGTAPNGDLVLPDNAVEFEPGAYVVPGIHMRPGIEVHEIGTDLSGDLKLDNEAFTAELSGAAADKASEIKVGDILMTDEVIARVAAVSNVNGVITVTLEDFVLWDVIHGEWSIEIELDRDEDDLYPITEEDYAVRHQLLSQSVSISASHEVNSVKFSAGGSATVSINPSFKFEGKIPFYETKSNYHCANPQIDSRVLFKRFTYCIDYLKMAVIASNEVSSNVSVTATLEASAAYPSKDNKRLFSKPMGEIPVAGPFSFKPSLYYDSQMQASLKATSTIDFTSSSGTSVPVGFEYRNGSGFSMLPNGGNPASNHSTLSGSVTTEGSLEASIYGELGVAMSVCTTGSTVAGACFEGLNAGARLTTKAQYKDSISTSGPHNSACLSLSTDLEVKLTGKAEVGVTAAAGTFEKSVILFEASATALSVNVSKWDDGGKYCLTGLSHQQHVKALNETFDVDVDCKDPDENRLIGTCAERFMVHCFDPEGECTGTAYEDGSYDMNWDTGERFESTIDKFQEISGIELPELTLGEFFGNEGDLCASQETTTAFMSGGGDGCLVSAIITLEKGDDDCEEGEDGEEECDEEGEGDEEGEEGVYRYKKGDTLETCMKSSGSVEYKCPSPIDGSPDSFTLDKDDDSKICMQGPCKFEKGYLDERDDNRAAAAE